jgi:hypothetical protein
MSVRSGIAVLVLALGSAAGTLRAQEPLTNVKLLATDTLQDVALTQRENGRAVIYYNPALIERVGPLLRDFFIAHEYGHVFYEHVGGALAASDTSAVDLRQRQELEADCYAAARLARTNRASVEAAVQFFTGMGLFSHDRYHPSGSRRAANLLACLPAAQADPEREAGAPNRGVSETDATTIELGPDAAARLRGLVRIRIDGRLVGTISTLGPSTPIILKRLRQGPHRYELAIELYRIDELLQVSASGVIRGDGTVEFERAGRLEVNWLDDEPPALLPVKGAPRRAIP